MKARQRQLSLLLGQLGISSLLIWKLSQPPVTDNHTTSAALSETQITQASAPSVDFQRLAIITPAQQQHILQRPLFTASRRPVSTVSQLQQHSPVTELTDWRLSGIITTGQVAVAMFKTDGDSKALQPGMQLDGWTVTQISRASVTLRQEDEQIQLKLHNEEHGG